MGRAAAPIPKKGFNYSQLSKSKNLNGSNKKSLAKKIKIYDRVIKRTSLKS